MRVTATFRHRAGVVLDLSVEGEGKAIGVTPTHLVWSPDRQAWVPVGEMRVGDCLAAKNGSTPCVLSLKQREQPEEVFNIEVDGDHVYRVGEQGLLVHNASADPNTCDPCGFGKKIKRKPQARPPKKIRPKKPSGGGGGGAGGGGGGGGLRPIQDSCYMKQTECNGTSRGSQYPTGGGENTCQFCADNCVQNNGVWDSFDLLCGNMWIHIDCGPYDDMG